MAWLQRCCFHKNTFCTLHFSRVCELASSFDKTLSYKTTIIDTTDTCTYQYHNLLICISSWELSGFCWASLDADICSPATTRTTLLSMFILWARFNVSSQWLQRCCFHKNTFCTLIPLKPITYSFVFLLADWVVSPGLLLMLTSVPLQEQGQHYCLC